jgi:hypothetical protein
MTVSRSLIEVALGRCQLKLMLVDFAGTVFDIDGATEGRMKVPGKLTRLTTSRIKIALAPIKRQDPRNETLCIVYNYKASSSRHDEGKRLGLEFVVNDGKIEGKET